MKFLHKLHFVDVLIVAVVTFCIFADNVRIGEWNVMATVAALCGVISVVLSARGYVLNYLFCLPSTLIYVWVAFEAGNYGDATISFLLLSPLQIVGYFAWRRRGFHGEKNAGGGSRGGGGTCGDAGEGSPVGPDDLEGGVHGRRLSGKLRCLTALACAVLIVIVGLILRRVGATAPWVDSTKTVLNVAAQILMSYAFLEQYFLWMAVDSLSVVLWVISALQGKPGSVAMIVMWSAYTVVAITGFLHWRRLSADDENFA